MRVWGFFRIFAANMELHENSVIIDNRLDRMLEPELGGHHFESLYSKGVLSARRLKNLLKKDGLGKSISSDI